MFSDFKYSSEKNERTPMKNRNFSMFICKNLLKKTRRDVFYARNRLFDSWRLKAHAWSSKLKVKVCKRKPLLGSGSVKHFYDSEMYSIDSRIEKHPYVTIFVRVSTDSRKQLHPILNLYNVKILTHTQIKNFTGT